MWVAETSETSEEAEGDVRRETVGEGTKSRKKKMAQAAEADAEGGDRVSAWTKVLGLRADIIQIVNSIVGRRSIVFMDFFQFCSTIDFMVSSYFNFSIVQIPRLYTY
jgi:hypothetical protein